MAQSKSTARILEQNTLLLQQNRILLEQLLNTRPRDIEAELAHPSTSVPALSPVSSPAASSPVTPVASTESADAFDVFVSLNCASSMGVAEELVTALHGAGISTWMCTSMMPGENFRRSIVERVRRCRFFVPLINSNWLGSGECEWEYNIAQRLSITKKTPQICPVFLESTIDPNSNWIVLALMTNQQVLFLDQQPAATRWQLLLEHLLAALGPRAPIAQPSTAPNANPLGSTQHSLSGRWEGYYFTRKAESIADKTAAQVCDRARKCMLMRCVVSTKARPEKAGNGPALECKCTRSTRVDAFVRMRLRRASCEDTASI